MTRSRDQLVNFFYDKLRLAQFAQTEMWELFCKEFASRSFNDNGLKAELPDVEVKTERQDCETGTWEDVSDQFGANAIS